MSLPVLIALLTLEMGIAVIVEAILSFVGLSVSSDTPTWGGMIAEGRQIIHQAWWVLAAPLAALFATVLAFNQLGDGLRAQRSIRCCADDAPRLAIDALSAPSLRDGDRPILREVSLAVGAGEVHGARRRERRRQVDHRQGDPRHPAAQVRITGGEHRLRRATISSRCSAKRAARGARPRHRADSRRIRSTALNPARRIDAQMTDGLRLSSAACRRAKRACARSTLLEEVQIRDPERVLRAIRMSFPAACASAC